MTNFDQSKIDRIVEVVADRIIDDAGDRTYRFGNKYIPYVLFNPVMVFDDCLALLESEWFRERFDHYMLEWSREANLYYFYVYKLQSPVPIVGSALTPQEAVLNCIWKVIESEGV